MIGKSILHYKILEKLGEGGMGVVYLAEDTKLKRQVAIKFLPGHIAGSSDERRRFEIEAQAAAALNHPNIATIHAIEETENDLFLVMEYIAGRHLKDHINSRPLPVDKAVDIAIQIARGLQIAHKKGIVHRDIKSANIMSKEDGHVKIMDFGLAKFRGSAQLTQIGTTVGTAAYMSPEQARGEDADQRADIWSFGIVFYEMLTGHPPFKGEYEQALIFNLLNEDITPVTQINHDVPERINTIISKCLQKDKEKRYQSMEDVLADLKTGSDSQTTVLSTVEKSGEKTKQSKTNQVKWVLSITAVIVVLILSWYFLIPKTGERQASKKMLVVLPFENLGNPENDYFADGITSEITSRLSGLSGLGVIARTSATQYKNTNKTLKEIAEELNIEYALVGTVQWQQTGSNKKRVRVNSELIQVQNSTQIWSKPYDADFADAFQLQSDIAGQVASALDLKLLSTEKKVLDEKLSDNPQAYDYYLRANNYYDRSYNKEDWDIAEKMFEKAIELDPEFTAAYARLSNLLVDQYWFYYVHSADIIDRAKQNIDKAESLDPDHYLVKEALGWYHYHGKLEYEPALKEFYISLQNQPNNAGVHMGIGSVYRRQGKMEKALQAFKEAVKVDPRSAVNLDQVGETLLLLRRYNDAEKYFDQAITMAPDHGNLYIWKAWIHLARDKNIAAAQKMILENNYEATYEIEFKSYTLFLIAICTGDFNSALDVCQQFKVLDDQFYFFPSSLLKAKVYEFLNDGEEARRNYNEALELTKQEIENGLADPRHYSTLGLIYAGLGQKEEAIKSGEYAVKLMPVSMEAWRGGWRLYDLAGIYLKVGETKKALNLLDSVLSMPLEFSINIIDMDPTWDPLKNLPGYKQLINKHSIN